MLAHTHTHTTHLHALQLALFVQFGKCLSKRKFLKNVHNFNTFHLRFVNDFERMWYLAHKMSKIFSHSIFSLSLSHSVRYL